MGVKRHRICWTWNKRQLMVLAYPSGCRPCDSASWLLPGGLGLIWVSAQYLRYRTARRGSWVVEIRDPNSEHAFATRTLSDEASAIALLDPVSDQLTNLPAIDDEQASHVLHAS
ncbi:MAG TPA: hypothetical protein VGN18_06130 [Jatrophihabitans sp.]|jgi:hypothetical protein|uniref:hypothetical protein n=1 Tax=Jatrophihabitans sp. TaxID=1932789 RepID=UPI002E0527CD|nr:hypothetical protein [Jatrophihabitans sp.]